MLAWKNLLSLLLLILFGSATGICQLPDYHVQLFDQRYGMTTNLQRVIKDQHGFIWMWSTENIFRFDGKNMKTFPNDEFLQSLIEDDYGNIWVNSSSNIYRFVNDYIGFVQIPFDTSNETSLGRLFQLPGKPLWLQTSIGFFEWNEIKNEFQKLNLDAYGIPAHVSTLSFSSYGSTIFFASDSLMYAVDLAKNSILTLPRVSSQGGINAVSEFDLLVTSRGDSTTWLDFKARQKRSIDFRNELPGNNNDFLFIRTSLPVDSNRVFLATHSGLLELDKDTRKFRRLKLYHKGYPLDPTPNYYSLFMDEEQKVWVLQGIGLVSFSADKESIGLIREREHAGTYIWPNNARNLVEDELGNLWMATSEGFGYWNQQNNEITMYPAIANAKDHLNIPSVRGMCYDKGILIMGTSSSGVWIYNTKTKSYRRPGYTQDAEGAKTKKRLEVDFIKQIIKLPDGNYFVVGRTCYILEKETFLAHDFSIESFTSKQPNFVFIANDQSIWLCTGDGVIHYDGTLHSIQSYYLGKSITAFNEYEGRTFFVGTSKGLFSIDLQGDTVLIADKDKIADFNRVTFIVKDHRGLFWIGANEGLVRLDPQTRQTEIYDYSDNVQGNVWAMEPLFARNGKLFIGGNNGINYFDPDKIEKKNERLQVTIMKVTVNQDDTSYFDRTNLLSLKSFQNSLDIQFVAPYYGNPQRLQYRYQMLGLSSEWKDLGNNNEVRFSRLPPGDYVFNVSASVNGQQWFQSKEALAFSIAAPFWQQWWFVLVCIILFCAVLFFYLTKRIKNIQQKELIKRSYEKKIAEVEMHALRAQMNPHFMFNSLNSINNFILKNDPDNASGYLTKFSRLMRLILDNSRSEWIVLENELKALELYIQLEVVRFDDVFEYELIVDPGVDVTTTFVPPMIIQPYVENAIWHGLLHRHSPGGKLVIRIWRTGDILHINVEDNGVGRQEATRLKSKSATKHKSHGLKITAERIDIVNRIYNVDAKVDIDDLTGQNGTAGGTRVSLTLKDKMHDSYNRG